MIRQWRTPHWYVYVKHVQLYIYTSIQLYYTYLYPWIDSHLQPLSYTLLYTYTLSQF